MVRVLAKTLLCIYINGTDKIVVVNGTVGYSSTLMNNTQLTAMNGEKLTITTMNGTYFVNSAKVLIPDILVANGVVHVIDK